MTAHRTLDVQDCAGTLLALFDVFAEKANASFEGDLSCLNLKELSKVGVLEISGLRRQTMSPKLPFVVVPLSRGNIAKLRVTLGKPGVLGERGRVIHTQIALNGELAFAACDNFHPECTFVSPAVSTSVLLALQAKGMIRGYSAS